MSTTLNKLEYLDETKGQIKTALNTKFSSQIQDDDTFRSYVSKISDIYTNWPKVTGEGTELTLQPTKKGKMVLDLKGNTSQDGEPTPDTPIPVQVVSGNNSIKIQNKNLFDINGTITQGTLDKYNNGFTLVKGTNRVIRFVLPKVLPAGTYTLSYDVINVENVSGNYFFVACQYTNTNIGILNNIILNDSGATFTTTSEFDRLYFFIAGNQSNDATITIDNVQLELGSSKTDFNEYKSQSYTINLGNIELCKIDDYKDRIYKSNDKWYIEKKIGKVVLTGATSENWAQNSSQTQTNTNYFSSNVIDNLLKSGEKNGVSSYFTVVNELWNTDIEGIQFSTSSSNIRLRINKTIASDLATFKTWLSNNNTIVYYILSTPTTTEITDITLIEQLENLQKAYSYDTQTNISQTNVDLEFIISSSALMKGGN